MKKDTKLAYMAARALIGALFFISGLGKAFAFSYVAGWMASSGVPLAGVLLVITILIEVGGGLMLITGVQSRWSALGIALFLIPVTLVFHAFWNADAANFQNQLTQFLKNAAIFGGLILVFQREKIEVQS